MRIPRKFIPSSLQTAQLEERVVLSGIVRNQAATSVLLQGLNGQVNVFRRNSAPAAASLVDLAYQSFQQDFRAARATYLAAVTNGTASTADMTAFQNYTIQRTNLLAQQVNNSFLLYRAGVSRGHGLDSPLPLIIYSINGIQDRRAMPRQIIPLVTQLTGFSATLVTMRTTPTTDSTNPVNPIPMPGASATTIALDTIAQDNAIEASRVSTLNSTTIVRNGNFGNRNGHN
jgi:hypothetical protein